MENISKVPLNFKEFASRTKNDWLSKAEDDLRNNPVSSLTWNPFNGKNNISLEPYYSFEDMHGLEYLQGYHNSRNNHSGWNNYIRIYDQDPDFTQKIKTSMDSGVNGIMLHISDLKKLKEQTKWIFDQKMEVSIHTTNPDKVLELFSEQGISINYLAADKIPDLSTLENVSSQSPIARSICISSNETGIDLQLLDYILKFHNVLNAMVQNDIDPSFILNKTFIYSKTGSEYFIEIAKLRALRILIEALHSAYSFKHSQKKNDYEIEILCESPAYINESYEPHGNMLKSTYAAMASVIGGCDALIIEPEDQNASTQNVAIQVSNILREEACLGKVSDPAGGSCYIENLTHQLVSKTWKEFLTHQSGK